MAQKTRALIIGSGGIGTMVAFNLQATDHVSVISVLRSNYDVVKSHGFNITSCDHGKHSSWRPSEILNHIPESSTSGDDTKPFDYVICTTKNVPDVSPTLAELIRPAISPGHSIIILIQNGLNIEKPIQEAFPQNICLSGVSFMSAHEFSPGYILQNDTDHLIISPFLSPKIDKQRQINATLDFQKLYAASGKVQCVYEPDATFARWRKLLYNAVWNPVCALTNLDTTRLRLGFDKQDPTSPVNMLVRPAINEVRAAAKAAAGVELPEELVEIVIDADPVEIFCVPSMLQDRRKERFLEHENLVGEVLREGEKAGVEMPILRCLYGLCRAVQWQTKNSRGLIDTSSMLEADISERPVSSM